jgi:hypothetical protein
MVRISVKDEHVRRLEVLVRYLDGVELLEPCRDVVQ